MKSSNYNIGRWGEAVTRNFLQKQEYKILHSNYRCKFGEIDIIAKYSNYIVFVEVKTRKNSVFPGGEAITNQKKERLRKVALCYLKQNSLIKKDVRFDVVIIENGKIDLIKNAFMMYNN